MLELVCLAERRVMTMRWSGLSLRKSLSVGTESVLSWSFSWLVPLGRGSTESFQLLLQLLELLIEHNLLSLEVLNYVWEVLASLRLLLLVYNVVLRLLVNGYSNLMMLKGWNSGVARVKRDCANRNFLRGNIANFLSVDLKWHVIGICLLVADHTSMHWLSLFQVEHIVLRHERSFLAGLIASLFVLMGKWLHLVIVLMVHISW